MVPYLKQSLKNLFRKPNTENFSLKETVKPVENYRGRLVYDPSTCVNCGMCIKVCSPQCIERVIKPMENGDQEITFTFDMSSCTFCANCADFCSRKSIVLSDDYMILGTQHEDFLVSGTFVKKAPPPKPTFTPEQLAEMKAKAAAARAAAAGGAAAPAAKPEASCEGKQD